MKKKNYLLALILMLLSISVFAQVPDYPPPPFSTEAEPSVTIDDWAVIMALPAILLALFKLNKAKK